MSIFPNAKKHLNGPSIRHYRMRLGLTQEQAATQSGFTASVQSRTTAWSQLETGRRLRLPADRLVDVAKTLQVPVSMLFHPIDGRTDFSTIIPVGRLRELRIRLGLTAAEAGRRAGFSNPSQQWYRYEGSTIHSPRRETCNKLARALQATPAELTDITPETPESPRGISDWTQFTRKQLEDALQDKYDPEIHERQIGEAIMAGRPVKPSFRNDFPQALEHHYYRMGWEDGRAELATERGGVPAAPPPPPLPPAWTTGQRLARARVEAVRSLAAEIPDAPQTPADAPRYDSVGPLVHIPMPQWAKDDLAQQAVRATASTYDDDTFASTKILLKGYQCECLRDVFVKSDQGRYRCATCHRTSTAEEIKTELAAWGRDSELVELPYVPADLPPLPATGKCWECLEELGDTLPHGGHLPHCSKIRTTSTGMMTLTDRATLLDG